jgi:hypothetical protein
MNMYPERDKIVIAYINNKKYVGCYGCDMFVDLDSPKTECTPDFEIYCGKCGK